MEQSKKQQGVEMLGIVVENFPVSVGGFHKPACLMQAIGFAQPWIAHGAIGRHASMTIRGKFSMRCNTCLPLVWWI